MGRESYAVAKMTQLKWVNTVSPPLMTRYMTIDKVPDCIGVMKFERVKDGEVNEEKEVDMDD